MKSLFSIVGLAAMTLQSIPTFAVDGGAPTSLSEIPAIVGVIGNSRQMSKRCSGVLIDVDLVLTAAHCVMGEFTFYALQGNDLRHPNNWSNVKSVEIDPGATGVASVYDLALVHLEKPMVDKSQLPRIATKEELQTISSLPSSLFAAGYGNDQTGISGVLNSIEYTGQTFKFLNGMTLLESSIGGTNEGDSGGPFYMKTSQGELVLLGVHTGGNVSEKPFLAADVPAYRALTMHADIAFFSYIKELQKTSLDQAKSELLDFIHNNAHHIPALILYANILYDQGSINEADEYLRNLTDEDVGTYVPFYVLQAKIKWKLDPNSDIANMALSQVLSLDPSNKEIQEFVRENHIDLED